MVRLRVTWGAGRTALRGVYGVDALKRAVAAPPVDGRANAGAEWFLAGVFGVPGSSVEVVRGAPGRDRAVFVRDVGVSEARGAISAHLR